jgi:hypothetical protein
MSSRPPPRPQPTPISKELIPTLLSADASIYPSPLTLATLTSWITAAPTYALQYLAPTGALAGVVIALPLRLEYWKAVTYGHVKEWEITAEMLAPEDSEVDVGVHIWHVERYSAWIQDWGRFGDSVMEDLGAKRWSALCVTAEGRTMMERFGGREGRYQGQVVVDGVLQEREEWDGCGMLVGYGIMIIGGLPDWTDSTVADSGQL